MLGSGIYPTTLFVLCLFYMLFVYCYDCIITFVLLVWTFPFSRSYISDLSFHVFYLWEFSILWIFPFVETIYGDD